MINPFFSPIFFKENQIEIKTLDLCLAGPEDIHRFGADGDRRKPWWSAKTLLGTTVADIDSPSINLHIISSQGGHRIHHQKGMPFLAVSPNLFKGLPYSGGSLSMNNTTDFGLGMFPQSLDHFLWLNLLSPFFLNPNDFRTTTRSHLSHPVCEEAIYSNDNHISRLNEIDVRGLHPRTSCTRDCQGHPVFCLENAS